MLGTIAPGGSSPEVILARSTAVTCSHGGTAPSLSLTWQTLPSGDIHLTVSARASVSQRVRVRLRPMDLQQPSAAEPEWWQPYAEMFPSWHAWDGVSGLCYARLPHSSPPQVVYSRDPADLPELIQAIPPPWWRRRS